MGGAFDGAFRVERGIGTRLLLRLPRLSGATVAHQLPPRRREPGPLLGVMTKPEISKAAPEFQRTGQPSLFRQVENNEDTGACIVDKLTRVSQHGPAAYSTTVPSTTIGLPTP